MKSLAKLTENKPALGWALFLGTILLVFLLGMLASSIIERRAETLYVNVPKTTIGSFEPRNEIWGQNYPREFQSYYGTADTSFRSRYGGNAMIDMLEENPEMVVLWAGYLFSGDYNQGRGHYYAIRDIYNTLRTGAPMNEESGPQPATCWTCKSPDVPRVMNQSGVAQFYTATWAGLGSEIINPIGCADCHDPKTANLHISRPALLEAFSRQGRDVNKAGYQEMRSLVCAQCHVEYYFDKEKVVHAAYLTFPWDSGFTAEAVEKYYDNAGFSDWTHAMSKTPMLKAQHPDYEIFTFGIHSQRGVACADCHMPYISEGGQKFTNHKMQSPLNNMAASCQVCHREEAETLVQNVYDRQDKILVNRKELEKLLVRAHLEAKKAWELGATEIQMSEILKGIRHAQWRWDFVATTHGGSFHAPVETGRIVSTGINIAQETRIKLARLLMKLGYDGEVPYPDISTKAKAQEFIGLNMTKSRDEKAVFLKEIVPAWREAGEKRQASWH